MTASTDSKNIDLPHAIEEMTKTLLTPDGAGELGQRAIELMKKYPLHAAMVAGGVGFLLGSFLSRKTT